MERALNGLIILTLFSLGNGCAALQRRQSQPDAATLRYFGGGEWVRTASGHCYSKADVVHIEDLGEEGYGPRDVATRVGGTPDDVREVEQRMREARRRSSGPAQTSHAARGTSADRYCAGRTATAAAPK